MKKNTIYGLAVFYSNKIAPVDIKSFATARYLRDAFKDVLAQAQTIEKDRAEIFKSEKTDEEKNGEATKLFAEEYPVIFQLNVDILEQNGIAVKP